MEFDHLFICVEDPIEGAEALSLFGLTEGSSSHHPGQGTANRRFYFDNSFIELLYATDHDELRSKLTKPTNLHQRFESSPQLASPFGVCFRPSDDGAKASFESWSYKPNYLPPGLEISVANSPSTEPMWFFLSFGKRPDAASTENQQPLEHNCGFKSITSIKIYTPSTSEMSAPAKATTNVTGIEMANSQEHLLQIGFDLELQGNQKDFRPVLPLVIRW